MSVNGRHRRSSPAFRATQAICAVGNRKLLAPAVRGEGDLTRWVEGDFLDPHQFGHSVPEPEGLIL